MTKPTDWHNCYDLSWKGVIVDEAFSHPAKFSHALIRRIYQHALEEGWLKPGDTVVDPFSGVGLGALYAMKNGLNWVGCELEQKFVDLGQQNIAKWNREYAVTFPNWGSAVLVQGDSRRLAEVVREARLVVSSPPFGDSIGTKDKKFWNKHNDDTRNWNGATRSIADYGHTTGQLANLPEGDITIVSSPPFAGNTGGRGEASRNGIDAALFDRHSGGMKRGTGNNPQNLDHLKEGDVRAVVGSPPFEDQNSCNDPNYVIGRKNGGGPLYGDYGHTAGQLGTDSGETFWAAAQTIVAQCYQILPVGGMAIWVTKRYVKKGQIVDFTGNWIKLCESVGFELVCHHRAWLVKDHGQQLDMFSGRPKEHIIERKSLFRRLIEAKARARKHWDLLTRADQANLLWEAHRDEWRYYKEKSEEPINEDDPKILIAPTRSKILSSAQSSGWTRDGSPRYKIEIAIDWEDVICLRKV